MEVFFYGLFMDRSILRKNGIEPQNPRKGVLHNYSLEIGNRASLIPAKNEQAFGIVMYVSEASVHQLYAEQSVADYIPEEVTISLESSCSIQAICYNLPSEKLTGTNSSYARSLYELAKKQGFPKAYLEKIKEMADR